MINSLIFQEGLVGFEESQVTKENKENDNSLVLESDALELTQLIDSSNQILMLDIILVDSNKIMNFFLCLLTLFFCHHELN